MINNNKDKSKENKKTPIERRILANIDSEEEEKVNKKTIKIRAFSKKKRIMMIMSQIFMMKNKMDQIIMKNKRKRMRILIV